MAQAPLLDPGVRASLMTTASDLLKERAALVARIPEIDAQLAAIGTLTGEALVVTDRFSSSASAPAEEVVQKEPDTWSAFLLDLFSRVNGGLTRKQVMAAIKKSPNFAYRYAKSPNTYYNTILRLENTGTLTKRGDVTYLKATWEKISKGLMKDETAPDEEQNGMAAFVTKVLEGSPVSMTAAEVIAALRAIPDARAKMEQNKQISYATLSRMAGVGLIKKDADGRYRVRDDQEPPNRTLRLLEGGSGNVS